MSTLLSYDPVVTVADAKTWCRIDGNTEDDLIQAVLNSSIAFASSYTRRTFRKNSYRKTLDDWTSTIVISDPTADEPQLIDVQKIEAMVDSEWQVWAASNYQVVVDGGFVYALTGPAHDAVPASIRITYSAGYLPSQAVTAIKLLTATNFENREAVVVGSIVSQVPFAVTALLDQIVDTEFVGTRVTARNSADYPGKRLGTQTDPTPIQPPGFPYPYFPGSCP